MKPVKKKGTIKIKWEQPSYTVLHDVDFEGVPKEVIRMIANDCLKELGQKVVVT